MTAIGMLAIASLSAQSADDLEPPVGYRNWFHVNSMIVDKASPLFNDLGGMHNVHVNSLGEGALKTGGPYPDGTVFLTDLHDFSVVDGTYVEDPLKGLAVMKKDSKRYASTGGWGFQFWPGGDPKKPAVTNAAKQCLNVISRKRITTTSIPPTFHDPGERWNPARRRAQGVSGFERRSAQRNRDATGGKLSGETVGVASRCANRCEASSSR